MKRSSPVSDAQAPLAEGAASNEELSPAEGAPSTIALEEHLPEAGGEEGGPRELAAGGLRIATPRRREGRGVLLAVRGRDTEVRVAIAPEVDAEVVDDAILAGDGVLVETVPGEPPLVVGVLTRRRPEATVLRGTRVTIEADDEVLLRAGTSALRLRSDGDVEVVGSRISATSRGLFRLVGRLLRLN